jgi:hypothetical protein
MSETEPIDQPMLGHRGIVAIEANTSIAYIAIAGSTDRTAWIAMTVE